MVSDPAPVHSTRPVVPTHTRGESDLYRYEPSGIRERSGYIPLWLTLVAFGLFVWSVHYAWRYWDSY